MEIDPDDLFRDDEDDPDNELFQGDRKDDTHFHVAVSCIAQSLKTQIINNSYDEVAICFFNTREKRNLQDLNGVYVFNVADREYLDRPTARLIKEIDNIEESFMSKIGSQYGIVSGSRENSLYNVLWVAQALLRKGSAKTADKRVLLFTNEDDPFGSIKGVIKTDMMRTTLQRTRDAQDLGISIELLPLSRPDSDFNVSTFYSDLLGLKGDDLALFMPAAGEKSTAYNIGTGETSCFLTDSTLLKYFNLLISHIFRSMLLIKTERSFICADTGALVQGSAKRFQPYKTENIKFSVEELLEIKRFSTGHLRLLGFKPLNCLKEFHNLRPSTFVFPTDEELIGSTCIFIALHRSMLRLKRFAVAFYGSSSRPQLVALVAQDEIISAGGQVEPPGMHMIYLPYSEDIRNTEELHTGSNVAPPHANDDQTRKAAALIKRFDLKDFSVFQFANPALQRHYAVLQALALEEDEIPEIKDETVPDEEGMSRPAFVSALEEFKQSVYGDNYEEENDAVGNGKASETSKKRKAVSENAVKESGNYDWVDLADNGKLKDLTVTQLKYYLTANNLPLAGKKEALISRILTHMGK
ncbi:ATP-dependent DNA helicase 2 subunit KU70 [Prunus yedoensis var. nudiflora]|uniref:ATP-dependent DNA helicase 2 subunit KU70 n=1 Tax=Prunus yedoensis var. nudiflora TaxID=2094558 RepID=A0A314UJR0_PRUYE|nr:ATP-dependent DNA helicase 2 subunit KU70 [Prunus yedoensis var. nudiflora]